MQERNSRNLLCQWCDVPVQIIASSELDMDLHVQLKALTDNLDEPLMWKYLQEVSVFYREGKESCGCCASGYCKQ